MNPTIAPALIDADELARRLPMTEAIKTVEQALRAGLDPEADLRRTVLDLDAETGQLLLMPSTSCSHIGVKIGLVAPHSVADARPRVAATYLLMDAATLAPAALIDGAALTLLRTPAVSAVAVDRLAVPDAEQLVVFGTGPQARAHVEAFRAVRPIASIGVVGHRAEQATAMVEHCRASGLDAHAVAPRAVADADIIACCTTSRTPLFPGKSVAPHAVVVAIGSHEPTAREVDSELVERATVVVEARNAALREAGDILIPLRANAVNANVIAGNLSELVRGAFEATPTQPKLFKSVGMSWQDLVLAAAVVERASPREDDTVGRSFDRL